MIHLGFFFPIITYIKHIQGKGERERGKKETIIESVKWSKRHKVYIRKLLRDYPRLMHDQT